MPLHAALLPRRRPSQPLFFDGAEWPRVIWCLQTYHISLSNMPANATPPKKVHHRNRGCKPCPPDPPYSFSQMPPTMGSPPVRATQMPPQPNREDIDATYAYAPTTLLRPMAALLIPHSWEYLQLGITKIMTNLQDGMDMTAVCLKYSLGEVADRFCSTWASTRMLSYLLSCAGPMRD